MSSIEIDSGQAPHRFAPRARRLAMVLVAMLLVTIDGTASNRAEAGVVVIVPGCAIPPSDIVGWWPGEGDLSAAIGPDLTGLASFAPSLIGQGITLDAIDDLTIAGFPTLSDGVTISAWVKPVATGLVQAIATRWDFPGTDDSARSYALLLDPSGTLTWTTDDTTARRPEELQVNVPDIFDGDFRHVAATWSSTTMSIYVDGFVVGSKPSQGGMLNPAASTPFRLGSKSGLGDPFRYTGTLDEPAIMRRALTAAEVDDIAAAGPGGLCTASSGVVGPGLQFEADAGGVDPLISADGRYVLARTRATDLFPVVNDPMVQTPGVDYDQFDNSRDDLVLIDTKNSMITSDDTIELVSVDSNELGGGLDSAGGAMTPTASHIAFTSISNDLVPGDTLAGRDVFVRDRANGTTTRVSVRSDGSQPQYTATGQNNDSRAPSISDSGTVVAFESTNRDLAPEANPVPGDTWQVYDVYVRDTTDPNPVNQITERITTGLGGVKADGSSSTPILSPDGRYVFFSSAATNLVAGDTNGHTDLFVHDRQAHTTARIDVTVNTGQALDGDVLLADVSPNNRWIAFSSDATTVSAGDTNGQYDAFLLDTQSAHVFRMSPPTGNGASFARSVSSSGRYVVVQSDATNLVAGDTNGLADVFMADRVAGSIQRVSLSPGGGQRDGSSTGVTASATNASFVYMFQPTGSGVFSIWRSDLILT